MIHCIWLNSRTIFHVLQILSFQNVDTVYIVKYISIVLTPGRQVLINNGVQVSKVKINLSTVTKQETLCKNTLYNYIFKYLYNFYQYQTNAISFYEFPILSLSPSHFSNDIFISRNFFKFLFFFTFRETPLYSFQMSSSIASTCARIDEGGIVDGCIGSTKKIESKPTIKRRLRCGCSHVTVCKVAVYRQAVPLVRTVHESEQKPLKGVVLLFVAFAEPRLHR